MQNTLLVVLGPTGSGKTDLAVDLAIHFNTEIISCDSRQFYKEMEIGTALPSKEQLGKVKHHFISFLPPEKYYSASLYERDVIRLLGELFKKHPVVIIAGGSALYSDAVCYGIDDIPDIDPGIRKKYMEKYSREGIEGLRIALKILDPEYYEKADLRNHRRITRALEICETTGRPYSSFLTGEKRIRDFRIIRIGLEKPMEELYGSINARVEGMIEAGLEEEAGRLYIKRDLNSLNTVGYKELFGYFENRYTREKAIELIKRNTRRYAKKQMTWWGKDKTIKWFHPRQKDDIIEYVENKIGEV